MEGLEITLILVVNAMSASKKKICHVVLSYDNRIVFDFFQEILFWKIDSVVKNSILYENDFNSKGSIYC